MCPDFIESQARSIPDRAALWFDDSWFTYAELNLRARRLANRLAGLGIRQGDRVGILAPNHIAHIDSMLAAAKLGHVHLPLNHRLGLEELRLLVARVAPSLLFVDDACAAQAAALGIAWLPLAAYEAGLAGASAAPVAPATALTPDDLHMILFTGGSTGTPKGACLPYRQTLGNAADTVAAWGLGAGDGAIQCTPCFHAAMNVLTLPLLLAGGRVLLMPRFEAGDYLRLAVRHGVSLLFMVPTMFRALAGHPDFDDSALPALRWAITGGAPCPPSLRERYARRGIELRLGYGMTEAGVNCVRIAAGEAARAPDSVGRPMPGLTMVLRREDGTPVVAPDEVGELTLSGPQICRGYFCAEDAAAASEGFRDGWLWTGDLASCDRDGRYTIRGRRKDLYISGGENIYPAEIEAALARCDGVAECTVFGWPHEHWGECGVALVVLQPGAPADEAALRRQLRQHLAGYKMPAQLRFVAELPRAASGKILKAEARALHAAAGATDSPPPAADLSAAA
ncbi:MAG: long-chain fatty acid--CoA ligase [Nevskia sp.]